MYVAISGNIGSGKSTLTSLMAARYALRPVFEAVDENPYLQDFYADMSRWAFHSQAFFLARRLEQHLLQVNASDRVIQDRTIYEDALVFARNLRLSGNLDDRDWSTYQALYRAVTPALRAPGLLVYLDCSVSTLEQRIAGRGRAYERSIPTAYLERLKVLYDEWVASYDLSPVLRVPGDRLDFVSDPEAFTWICAQVEALGLEPPVLDLDTEGSA